MIKTKIKEVSKFSNWVDYKIRKSCFDKEYIEAKNIAHKNLKKIIIENSKHASEQYVASKRIYLKLINLKKTQ